MEDAGKKRVECPPYWVDVCLLPRATNQSVSHIWTVHGDGSPGSELPHLLQLLEFSLLPSLPGCPSPLSSADFMAACSRLEPTPSLGTRSGYPSKI